MKHLVILILLATCSIISAQDLYVSTGSYVYVDGTAFTSGPTVAPLYVTDAINLQINSHIYLRNGAQLLQNIGTMVTSTNTGEGQLSVYQTGTSNTYMYNYWCSPVGINSGAAGNTNFGPNNIIYGETATPITSLVATYLAEPIYNGVAGSVGTPPEIASFWLYSFTGLLTTLNAYEDWLPIDETSSILAPGYGWTMKGNPSVGGQQYDFRGRPNNGTISTLINAERETLVGNPYPSALDARAFIHDTNNAGLIDSATLSFWEQDPANSTSHVLTNYQGGYATYTITSGGTVGVFMPATFDTYDPDGTINTIGGESMTLKEVFRYIAIGQGFMVKGNIGITPGSTLRTTNNMRAYQKEGGLSEFFRTSNNENSSTNDEVNYNENGLSIMPEGYKRFRINLDFNETYTRQLAQTFHHTATAGEDYGLETLSPDALDADAYWPQGEKAYNAQAFNFDVSLRIPMVININEEQTLRFRIFDIQNFEESQGIYIHDIENETYVNLRNQYFELNIEPGNYTDRFEIVFTSEAALDVDEFDINTLTINQNNGLHKLSVLNPKSLNITAIEVYDVAGKRLLQGSYDDAALNRYELSTTSLSDGVYVVNVKSNTSAVKSQKIIVKN